MFPGGATTLDDAVGKRRPNAEQLVVPYLGNDANTAVIQTIHKNPGARVVSGDRLFTLKANSDLIHIYAEITGFMGSLSAGVGATVRSGNSLGQVLHGPWPLRMHWSVVDFDGLPICLRVDYVRGFTVIASEWVCPDADGPIGKKGKDWWHERTGTVPECPQDAVRLTKNVPPPYDIDVEASVDKNGPPTIKKFCYWSYTKSISFDLPAINSVVLAEADRKQFLLCRDTVHLLPQKTYKLEPAPHWWPSMSRGSGASLANPFDRHSVPVNAKSEIRETLKSCRNFFFEERRGFQITYSQAINNISMSYSLSEAPMPEEVGVFFSSFWPRGDIVFNRYKEELFDALRNIISAQWFCDVIDPIIGIVAEHYRNGNSTASGPLGGDGTIKCGLVWAAQSYYMGEVIIPCIEIGSILFPERNAHVGRILSADSRATSIPSFSDTLRAALREGINVVRQRHGLPQIGEGWITETDLYNRVKRLFPGLDVIHHGRPKWLGRQHFDIWIPEKKLAIEYHGEQHFVEISLFGGKEALAKTRERDERKRSLCKQNGVQLVEIAFNDDLTDKWLASLLGASRRT